MLAYGRPYRAPRVEGLDQQQTKRLIRHHTKRLNKLREWLPKAPVLCDSTQVLRKLEAVQR